jgi:hypothetical protein
MRMRLAQPRRDTPERCHPISLGDGPEVTERVAALQQLQQHSTAQHNIQENGTCLDACAALSLNVEHVIARM